MCLIVITITIAWGVYKGIRGRTSEAPLRIAAMQPGTSWYVFGATLAQLLEPELGEGRAVEIFARGGGIGNPSLVERGKTEIGIAQLATAVWAWNGDGAYGGVRHRRLRALAGGLNAVRMTAVAREEYARRTGNDTLEKALLSRPGPRIVIKPPGSAPPAVFDLVLESLGMTRETVRRNGGAILELAVNQIADRIADGRADIYFEGAVRGHPTLTEVTTTTPMVFYPLSGRMLEFLSARGLKPDPLPAWFKGQRGAVAAADCGTILIARDDLAEEVAYLITKTICENREAMARAHKAWAEFEPAAAGRMENTGIPLHPGAERYYREKGWL